MFRVVIEKELPLKEGQVHTHTKEVYSQWVEDLDIAGVISCVNRLPPFYETGPDANIYPTINVENHNVRV